MTTNRLTGIAALLLGLPYLYLTLQLPRAVLGDPLGPRVIPLIAGVGIVLSGLVLITVDFFGSPKTRERIGAEWKKAAGYILATLLIGLGYAFIFEELGFVLATFPFMMALLAFVNRGKWILNAVVALVFSLGTYMLFAKLLSISLPRGLLPF